MGSSAGTTAAAAVALGLALVVILLLALLANLFYCFFRQRRHHDHHTSKSCDDVEDNSPVSPTPSNPFEPSAFPFYAHGVLQAPTSCLLSLPKLEAAAAPPSFSSPTFTNERTPLDHTMSPYKFVRISNPIYDGLCSPSGLPGINTTPFETPGSSPSCLGNGMEEEEEYEDSSPPLNVMKKLPTVLPKTVPGACLVDGRCSLAISASGTDTNRPSSSSSSDFRCYSPSW